MSEHKFQLGEIVSMAPSVLRPLAGPQSFEVTRLLPERDGELQYRVKSTGENHERVVRESELFAPGGVPETAEGR
jgi:hypothetical protein